MFNPLSWCYFCIPTYRWGGYFETQSDHFSKVLFYTVSLPIGGEVISRPSPDIFCLVPISYPYLSVGRLFRDVYPLLQSTVAKLVSLPIGGEVISRLLSSSEELFAPKSVSLPIGGEVISRQLSTYLSLLITLVSLPIGGEVISRHFRSGSYKSVPLYPYLSVGRLFRDYQLNNSTVYSLCIPTYRWGGYFETPFCWLL